MDLKQTNINNSSSRSSLASKDTSENDQQQPQKECSPQSKIAIQQNAIILQKFDNLILQEYQDKCFSRQEWIQIVQGNELNYTSQFELKCSLRQGIPDDLRPRIWYWLAQVNQYRQQHNTQLYEKLKTLSSPSDYQIQLDVPRTFNNEPFFKNGNGKQMLSNILQAYANYDKEIGYIQGMNFIVGNILLKMDPSIYEDPQKSIGKSKLPIIEEICFWIFINICFEKNQREVYKKGFNYVKQQVRFLEEKIKRELPEIWAMMLKYDVQVQPCFDQIFFTILMYHAPKEFSARIIDIFLLEGENIIFDIIIRMMTLCKQKIMSQNSFEDLFQFLKGNLIKLCFDHFKDNLQCLIPNYQSENITSDK